jgi:hypothetical protein
VGERAIEALRPRKKIHMYQNKAPCIKSSSPSCVDQHGKVVTLHQSWAASYLSECLDGPAVPQVGVGELHAAAAEMRLPKRVGHGAGVICESSNTGRWVHDGM